MYQEPCPYINQLLRVLEPGSGVQFVLFEVPRKIGRRIRHDPP